MTRNRKGKWAGFPATIVARLLGCSPSTAKRLLASFQKDLGRDLEIEDLGKLVGDYHTAVREKDVEKFLSKWDGPI